MSDLCCLNSDNIFWMQTSQQNWSISVSIFDYFLFGNIVTRNCNGKSHQQEFHRAVYQSSIAKSWTPSVTMNLWIFLVEFCVSGRAFGCACADVYITHMIIISDRDNKYFNKIISITLMLQITQTPVHYRVFFKNIPIFTFAIIIHSN